MPSNLPLSFLCQIACENQRTDLGTKFGVPGAGGTHTYSRSEAGKLTFIHKNLPESCGRVTDGWQFFISILPEDRDKAWPLLSPFLLQEKNTVLAFAVDDSDTRGVIPEEAIVLYTFKSRMGILLQSPSMMFKLCQDIERALHQGDIRTGDGMSNSIKLNHSCYISMKYINKNKNKKQDTNPYESLIIPPSKERFFSVPTPVAINDVVLLEDDEKSVRSDLTC